MGLRTTPVITSTKLLTQFSEGNPLDPATAGFTRIVVATGLSDVVVHAGPKTAGNPKTATLLLHGAAGSWTTWLPLIRTSHEEGDLLPNVVALDLPGWGESGDLPPEASVDDMVDAVAGIATALGFTKWHLIGHSLGGHLALTLAARYPAQTVSVTAISATGPAALSVLRQPIRNFTTAPLLAGMLGAMCALAVLGPAGIAIVHALHRFKLLRTLTSPLFSPQRAVDPSVIDALAAEVRAEAFVLAAKAAARFDENIWSAIRCPVTLVRGRRDAFVNPTDDAWFAAALPHADQRVAAVAGHFAHIETARHPNRSVTLMFAAEKTGNREALR